jgi:hypothetical protein
MLHLNQNILSEEAIANGVKGYMKDFRNGSQILGYGKEWKDF